jgi:hypothetical protein
MPDSFVPANGQKVYQKVWANSTSLATAPVQRVCVFYFPPRCEALPGNEIVPPQHEMHIPV